jgi:D-alanyl-D-alanine carboxypeptidase (penicillin-binding protein 5/6)
MKMKKIFFLICALALPAQAFETTAKNAVVMDHQTGIVLYDKQAHEQMYPASMTKMMTAYMMFDALKSGKIKLEDTYPVSENAWRKQGSKMFVTLGSNVAISDLMKGIIIQSGNDGCIVFAEGFAGTEERFAELMTEKGKEIGLKNTVFKNATGWPDEQHVTTAYDLAMLAKRTIADFSEYYPVYSELEYVYHDIKQYNRNLLLNRNMGIDGLKTGHTEEAGYGITISGVQNGRRTHVVVAGLGSEKERANEAAKLYRYALTEFKHVNLGAGKVLANVPLWYGETESVQAVADGDAVAILPSLQQKGLAAMVNYDAALQAPIKKGDLIGALSIKLDNMPEQMLKLYAANDVAEMGLFERAIKNIGLLVSN